MKDLNLSAYGVTEMTQQEMLSIDGGNIFKDAVNWVKNAAEDVVDWVGGAAQDVAEFAKKYGNTDGSTGVHAPI
jgi:hypothetical protein